MLTRSDLRDRIALSSLERGRKQPKHTNERFVEQTVVTREPEAITKNDDSQDSADNSTSQHARCVTHRRVNKDSQRRDGKTMVKVDDEFMMNRSHAPT